MVPLVILGLIGTGLTACAPPKPSVDNADKLAGKAIKKIGKKYKLDDTQKTQLFTMYEDFRDNKELRKEYIALIDGWIEEVQKPHMDQEVVLRLMRRKHDLDMKSEPKIADQLKELHATLDENQRNRVLDKLNKARGWIGLGLN